MVHFLSPPGPAAAQLLRFSVRSELKLRATSAWSERARQGVALSLRARFEQTADFLAAGFVFVDCDVSRAGLRQRFAVLRAVGGAGRVAHVFYAGDALAAKG